MRTQRALRRVTARCSAFIAVALASAAAITASRPTKDESLDNGGNPTDEAFWATPANTPQSTFAGCSCLNPWFLGNGTQLSGSCRSGTSETQGLSWCLVNRTSCQRTPASQQSKRYLLANQILVDWDYCVPHNTTDTTNAGCSCLPVWGYGGTTYMGACQNPDDNPAGSWCLIAPGTCSGQPAGKSTAWHDGWDYCNHNTASSNSTTQSNASSSAKPPDRTLSGCQCAKQWTFDNVAMPSGKCASPDKDQVGPWCRVDERTCTRSPEQPRNLLGAWDYCALDTALVQLPPRNTTRSGCKCKARWTLYPSGGLEFGCQNPDDDRQGDWCVVDPASCSQPAGALAAIGNQQAYDYCSPPLAENITTNSPTNTHRTVAGCQCLGTWSYMQKNGSVATFSNGACGTPDEDPAGPWCIVDAKTCSYPPFAQDIRSYRHWDYCQPPTAPRTQSGCLCSNSWTYPNRNAPDAVQSRLPPRTYYGTYANPDADPLGPWCIVQPQTCTRGAPFGMLSAEEDSVGPAGSVPAGAPDFVDYQLNTSQAAASTDTSASSHAEVGQGQGGQGRAVPMDSTASGNASERENGVGGGSSSTGAGAGGKRGR